MAPLGAGEKRVDRDKGIIRGVKILGADSENGRHYTPEARALAVKEGVYEGRAVFTDHPAKPGDPRPVRHKLGRLVNIRLVDGVPYGDLEVLKSHPDAELVFEVAERMPEQLGLSHNAQGEGEEKDGVFVVHRITEVRSVDVVTEPATTNGFFEGRGKSMSINIRQLFEASWKKAYSKKVKNRPRLAARMKRLVEDDAMGVMDEPAEMEAAPAEPDEALKSGFCASCEAIIDKALGGEMDSKAALEKLKELLQAHEKLRDGDDEAEDDIEEEEEPKDEPKEEEGKKETEEQRRLKQLEAKDRARDLCEEAGVACDKVLLEALVAVGDEKAQKRLIEREKKGGHGGNAGQARGNPPRSGAGGKTTTTTTTTLEGVDTPEGALAALMG